jgi:hypothetical protein
VKYAVNGAAKLALKDYRVAVLFNPECQRFLALQLPFY